MTLNKSQRQHLRSLAHHLNPVVIIGGAGLTDNVMAEIENALSHHELIKVRVNAGDRDERTDMIAKIIATTSAEAIQTIGHIVVLFRRAEKPVIQLPKK